MSTKIRIVDTSEVGRAHAWHLGFAAANDAIFPRKEEEFNDLALDRCLWCAITDEDEILAMSYVHGSADVGSVEVGGLMVAVKTRGKGLGDIMMHVPLIHFLVNERPLRWTPTPTILTHVVTGNDDPRGIIERCGFAFAKSDSWSADDFPGLRTGPDGRVHGDEFHLQTPEALEGLACWADEWPHSLRDGSPAEIRLLEGETTDDWATVLRSMI